MAFAQECALGRYKFPGDGVRSTLRELGKIADTHSAEQVEDALALVGPDYAQVTPESQGKPCDSEPRWRPL